MMLPLPDLSKTLEELDGQDWGEPEWQSHLVLECHRLHRTPLRDYTPADFRRMVGQSLSLEFLVPLAFPLVTDDPFIETEYYPGDLLCALLTSDRKFWEAHPDLRAALLRIAESGRSLLDTLDESDRDSTEESFHAALSQFYRSA